MDLDLIIANGTGSHIVKHEFWIAHMVETLYGGQHLPLNQFGGSVFMPVGVVIAVQAGEDTTER